jgi:hypothetical protein
VSLFVYSRSSRLLNEVKVPRLSRRPPALKLTSGTPELVRACSTTVLPSVGHRPNPIHARSATARKRLDADKYLTSPHYQI